MQQASNYSILTSRDDDSFLSIFVLGEAVTGSRILLGFGCCVQFAMMDGSVREVDIYDSRQTVRYHRKLAPYAKYTQK